MVILETEECQQLVPVVDQRHLQLHKIMEKEKLASLIGYPIILGTEEDQLLEQRQKAPGKEQKKRSVLFRRENDE